MVNVYNTVTHEQRSVIDKVLDNLSKEEMIQHASEVATAKRGELATLFDLGCFRRFPHRLARHVVDTRWVLKWKMKEGKKCIKARITMRGFKDLASTLFVR